MSILKFKLRGLRLWKKIKRKYRIQYPVVVIVLAGENTDLDKACIRHLPEYMNRKYADNAYVFYPREIYGGNDFISDDLPGASFISLDNKSISVLYDCYCFWKYYDNIVFTFTQNPSDNMLQRYLDETNLNCDDAVCLALFHLRHVT